MSNDIVEYSLQYLYQDDNKAKELEQYFDMRKIIRNKGEPHYILSNYKLVKNKDDKNEISVFLDETSDIFYLQDIESLFSLLAPFNIVHFTSIDTTQKWLLDFDGPLSYTVCVSDKQTSGRGRSNRKWDSPLGCLMFSIKIPTSHCSFNLLEFAPHLSALAIVLTLNSIDIFNKLQFQIQWPYDIITMDSIKICGIINETKRTYEESYSVVGMGLHVNNSNSTCLKELIHSDKLISRSFLLSKYLIIFFSLLRSFCHSGFDSISGLYYSYWKHYNSTVTVTESDGNESKVVIKGITEDGYLKGQDARERWVELYSDHNCEDSMANLIAHFL